MTENEAIEWLRAISATQSNSLNKNSLLDRKEALHMAIVAFEELEKYRSIGTVEECQQARERQRAKKVSNRKLLRDLNGNPYSTRGDCTNCGNVNLVSSANYCNACGQKLDWSE